MRLVFMGTPEFSAVCLARLIADGHDIAGVFSQPDRPKGRGHKLAPTPVKELALEHDIPVFQPVKLRDGAALSLLRDLSPELIAVVAYGRLLPKDILELPPLGCVNVHASLLPKLRGAAPIQWSVINGDKITGVTTMYMAEELDAGDMILSRETPIGETETSGELFARLAPMGAELLSETLDRIAAGTAPRVKQDGAAATFAPVIDKKLAALDFEMEPRALCNLIRGLNPAPATFSLLDGKVVKVFAARPISGFSGKAGEILDAKRLIVGCGNGAVEFVSVGPEGKKPMTGEDFLRGKKLSGGELFTRY